MLLHLLPIMSFFLWVVEICQILISCQDKDFGKGSAFQNSKYLLFCKWTMAPQEDDGGVASPWKPILFCELLSSEGGRGGVASPAFSPWRLHPSSQLLLNAGLLLDHHVFLLLCWKTPPSTIFSFFLLLWLKRNSSSHCALYNFKKVLQIFALFSMWKEISLW